MLLQNFDLVQKATNYEEAIVDGFYPDYLSLLNKLVKEGATKISSNPEGIHCQVPKPSYNWIESRKCTKVRDFIPVMIDVAYLNFAVLYCGVYEKGLVFSFDREKAINHEGYDRLLDFPSTQLVSEVVHSLGLLNGVDCIKKSFNGAAYNWQQTLKDYIYSKTNKLVNVE